MTDKPFQIVRRAYGRYTVVEIVNGYQAASLRAMALEYERSDGEYSVYAADELPAQRAAPYGQSGLDWL